MTASSHEGRQAGAIALGVDGLSAGYGDLLAVRDVSLTVKPGELLAMFGRNGAGKTSNLLAFAGLLKARTGTITLFGRDITNLPVQRRIAEGLCCVQEGRRVFRRRTIADNLVLGTCASRLSRRERATRLERTFERFPVLADKRTSTADRLSGGQQQILAIAQALMAEPKVLLLDEPSAGLAPSILDLVMRTVAELKSEGLAIILVEQLVDRALGYADRVVVLDGGRIVHSGAADDADGFEIARDIYLAQRRPPGVAARAYSQTREGPPGG